MSNPEKPVISYSYTGFQASLGDGSFPGTQIDADFAELVTSIDETIDALADIRRADGALVNGIVTAESLSSDFTTLPTLVVNETFLNVKTHFGVLGDGSTGDSALLNAAMQNSANLGKTLYFPAGIYSTTVGFAMTVQMNIVMDQRAVLRGDFSGSTSLDVLRINIPTSGLTGDGRNMIIEGGSIFCNAGGNCAININNSVPMKEQFEMEIRNGNHAGWLRAIRIGPGNGAGDTGFNTIRNCNLSTLSASATAAVDLAGCSDGNRIVDNLIFGVGTAVLVDVALGAFSTIIRGNGMVCQNGAVRVANGSLVLIEDNQIEQNGVNGMVPSSSILVQGLSRISRAIRIINNNFGAGTNVDTSITLYNARGTVIDRNHFYTANVQDINFGDAGGGLVAMYNTLGPNNWLRGTRALIGSLTDTTRRMVIAEAAACVGNRGFWKPLPTLQNGYTAGTGLQYMVNELGDLKFKGILTGGTLTAATTICTMPAGARPQTLMYFPVGTAGATHAALQLGTSGTLAVHGAVALPNATVNLNLVSIPVEWLDTYEAGE